MRSISIYLLRGESASPLMCRYRAGHRCPRPAIFKRYRAPVATRTEHRTNFREHVGKRERFSHELEAMRELLRLAAAGHEKNLEVRTLRLEFRSQRRTIHTRHYDI